MGKAAQALQKQLDEMKRSSKAEESAESETSQPKEKRVMKKATKTKAAKSAKAGRRVKAVSGKLTGAAVSGKTYVKLSFEEGSLMVTPTSNREGNAAAVAKAIGSLI